MGQLAGQWDGQLAYLQDSLAQSIHKEIGVINVETENKKFNIFDIAYNFFYCQQPDYCRKAVDQSELTPAVRVVS